jgi:hypothetical protein
LLPGAYQLLSQVLSQTFCIYNSLAQLEPSFLRFDHYLPNKEGVRPYTQASLEARTWPVRPVGSTGCSVQILLTYNYGRSFVHPFKIEIPSWPCGYLAEDFSNGECWDTQGPHKSSFRLFDMGSRDRLPTRRGCAVFPFTPYFIFTATGDTHPGVTELIKACRSLSVLVMQRRVLFCLHKDLYKSIFQPIK